MKERSGYYMNWFKKVFSKKVDERQERDLMVVEHYGFWLMYWMLFAALVIQGVIMDKGDQVQGEWIVFMVTSVFVLIGWVRKGVWSYQSRKIPGMKACLGYSLIAGIVGGILGAISGLKWHQDINGVLICVAVYAGMIFVITFVVFVILTSIGRRRERMLEFEAIEEDEEDDGI